jgi:hypothetical protein
VTGQEIGRVQESGGGQNRRLVGGATDRQNAEQESDRTEKQTGIMQDRGFTGAELPIDSGQEIGGGKNKSTKWLEYLSNVKI